MRRLCACGLLACLAVTAVIEFHSPKVRSACCYFSAKENDILQPSQKAFITWDPKTHVESFTVQPRFEGNDKDFGVVLPAPAKPDLHEMPRDFFKELAVFTILKRREFPQSKFPTKLNGFGGGGLGFAGGQGALGGGLGALGGGMP